MTGGTLTLSTAWTDLLHCVGAQRRTGDTQILQAPNGAPVANPGTEIPSDRPASKFYVQVVGAGIARVRIPSMHCMGADQAGGDGSAAVAAGAPVYFESGDRDLSWIQARAESGSVQICYGICRVSSESA